MLRRVGQNRGQMEWAVSIEGSSAARPRPEYVLERLSHLHAAVQAREGDYSVTMTISADSAPAALLIADGGVRLAIQDLVVSTAEVTTLEERERRLSRPA